MTKLTLFKTLAIYLGIASIAIVSVAQEESALRVSSRSQVIGQQVVAQPIVQQYQTQPVVAQQYQAQPVVTAPPAYVNQPTTYVEAAPLQPSAAEQARRKRQDLEIRTEQKIVEKLESARIADEQRRAEKIFGNTFENDNMNNAQSVVTPLAPPPAPVVIVEAPTAAVNEDLANIISEEKNNRDKKKTFISGGIGMADYFDGDYIENKYAIGVEGGALFPSNFSIEGSFTYSAFEVGRNYFQYEDLKQYNFGVGSRYHFNVGSVTPNVGGMLFYTYRKYEPFLYQPSNYSDDLTSGSFDMAFVAGLDFEVAENIAVGLDYKYVWNLSNNKRYDSYRQYPGPRDYIEDQEYQVISVNTTLKF